MLDFFLNWETFYYCFKLIVDYRCLFLWFNLYILYYLFRVRLTRLYHQSRLSFLAVFSPLAIIPSQSYVTPLASFSVLTEIVRHAEALTRHKKPELHYRELPLLVQVANILLGKE